MVIYWVKSRAKVKWDDSQFSSLIKRRLQIMCQQQKGISSVKAFSEAILSIEKTIYRVHKFIKPSRDKFFIDLRNSRSYWKRELIKRAVLGIEVMLAVLHSAAALSPRKILGNLGARKTTILFIIMNVQSIKNIIKS